MNEWNIQSRAHACEVCARPFADKQSYRTVLFEEGAELRRSDICEPCAQKAGDARSRAGFISHWQGIFEVPPPMVDAIQKETAETVLRKLIEQNDPHYAPAAYILAVMLERKRILKVKEQITRDGQRVFIYEQPKTGDIFTIADPNNWLSFGVLLFVGLIAGNLAARVRVQADLAAWKPDAVVARTTPGAPLGHFLISLFGRPTVRIGQMLGWRLASH